MIYIYTDTSLQNNIATCTSLILSDTNFIGLVTETYEGICGSIHGELLAILQGIERVNPTTESIQVYTDSIEAIDHINGKVYVDKLIDIVNKINTFTTVQIFYTKGHAEAHTPNKVVDILARRISSISSERN